MQSRRRHELARDETGFSEDMNNRMHVDAGRANEVIVQCARDPHGRPRSWTFVCAAVGASFRLEGGDAEFGALTIQPSFVFHGTPLVTGAAAHAANTVAGLLGVAGFAKAAVLSARLEVEQCGPTPQAATRATTGPQRRSRRRWRARQEDVLPHVA